MRQVEPAQHVVLPSVQLPPAGVHCGAAQRSRCTPSGSTTPVHGVPPQHWPLISQMFPVGMQQSGSFPSQPVGQHFVVAVSTQVGSSTRPP